jgi:hypothetical protein
MRLHVLWIILGIAACLSAGCGPKARIVTVTGKVTYNGNPPGEEGCNIVFLGPDGKQVSAPIAPSGEYTASGVVAGTNKVAIYYRNPEAAKTRDPGAAPVLNESPLRNLPANYADVNKSELSVDADTGTVFDVNMKGTDLATLQKKSPPKKQKDNPKGRQHKTG